MSNAFQTRRQEIQAICDQINTVRLEYVKLVGDLNASVSRLVQCADQFLGDVDPEDRPIVRKLGYATKDPSPTDIDAFTAPRTRTCKLCLEPGHDSRTCTKGRKSVPAANGSEPAAQPRKIKRKK